MPGKHGTLQERLMRRVEHAPSGCWLWTGGRVQTGHGQITIGGKGSTNISTHRASWILHFGPIPPAKSVLHRCDIPNCVNPDHLYLGTQADNMRDMVSKGRSLRGARNPMRKSPPKLTIGDAALIRRLCSGFTQRKLAQRFGVSQGYISSNQPWKLEVSNPVAQH